MWVPGSDARQAEASDLPRLREIVDQAYSRYLPMMDRPPAPMIHDLAPDVEAGRVWVAGSPAVGLICLVNDGDALLVENVAVHPTAQGRGIGQALMEFAQTRARESGIRTLRLYTNQIMADNVRFYSHLGYREVERRVEDGYSRVFMEKQLTD